MIRLFLLPLSLLLPAMSLAQDTGELHVMLTPPTARDSGVTATLAEISGYRLAIQNVADPELVRSVYIANPSIQIHTFTGLAVGDWLYQATVYDDSLCPTNTEPITIMVNAIRDPLQALVSALSSGEPPATPRDECQADDNCTIRE